MSAHPRAGLGARLAWLDLLLHREILRLRAAYELSLDEFRGLYVSDEQVDRLVDGALREGGGGVDLDELAARAAELRRATDADGGPWARLVAEFGLTSFEEDVLLLAVAPEVDLKYETLYAYLNNDVSRRYPTRDLALRLFAGDAEGRWRLRRALLPDAPLLAGGLLRELDAAADRPGSLSTGLVVSPLAARWALGLPLGTHGLGPGATLHAPAEPRALAPARADELRRAARLWAAAEEPVVLALEGPRGSGRAEAAALVCRELGIPLVRVDLDAVRAAPDGLPALLAALALRQRLEPAGVYVAPPEGALDVDGRAGADLRALAAALAGRGGPLMLAAPAGAPWRDLLSARRCLVVRFEPPDRDERRRLWTVCLAERGAPAPGDAALDALADRFRLSAGQVRVAVTAALDAHRVAGGSGAPPPEALFRAAREESGHQLARLAARVDTPHGWSDLVLPPPVLRRVRELAAAVQHRHTVYTTWGFDRRLGPGQGLRALFAGPSGTGKTMAAGVIARELGLDLYRVDLAGVVSKYIGETEKNLERIFGAAHAGNAVLFFDEADALFGKRSEVKDAHDRYANIEVAYLLQRIEEHPGIVVLATNLRKNIDEAFARRMHYVVEFPLPDDAHREQLWRGMFPERIPLEKGVDFRFLARQFPLSGGDIRNVALEAAFLAAQDGRVVTMRHLVTAVARQLLKQGKIPSNNDFRQYHALLAGTD
ncbi:MAG TPA: ATP-binding protein [Longimicrobium sp.]|nr:ATP-binding protein [Longimicrobium sp.]